MSDKYILDYQGEPVLEPNLLRWAEWFETSWPARCVALTHIGRGVRVSTVFLGIDYSFRDDTPPILWETLVFNGPMDNHERRSAGKRANAKAMHDYVLKLAWHKQPIHLQIENWIGPRLERILKVFAS